MKSIQLLAVLVTLGCFIGVCYAQAGEHCDATTVTPVFNFTTEKVLGTWYVWKFIAKLPEGLYPLDFRCLEADILRAEESETFQLLIHERYINSTSGSNDYVNVTDYVMLSEHSEAAWKVFGFRGDIIRENDVVYVQTDYENWAIEYGCAIQNDFRFEDMTIFTRSRNPSQELISVLEAIIKNFGYDPVANGMQVDQTNC